MRILSAVVLAAAVVLPAIASAAGTTTYHIVYGTQDLGSWNRLQMSTKSGIYDGKTFDSSNGPGFKMVSFTRPLAAADKGLFDRMGPPNVVLTVQVMVDGATQGVITCPMSQIYSFGSNGDPGTGTEDIAFACTRITTSKTAP